MVIALAVGCGMTVEQPVRPDSVTPEAVWSGGVDGGSWADCRFAVKEPSVEFDCTIWQDDGQPWSIGRFAVWERRDGENWEPIGGRLFSEIRDFNYYDGEAIVISDSKQLRPQGWIDYPFGDGHGKRVKYANGEEVDQQSY